MCLPGKVQLIDPSVMDPLSLHQSSLSFFLFAFAGFPFSPNVSKLAQLSTRLALSISIACGVTESPFELKETNTNKLICDKVPADQCRLWQVHRPQLLPLTIRKSKKNLICYSNIFSDPKRVNAPLVFHCDGFFVSTHKKNNRTRPSMTLSTWVEHTSPSPLQPLAHSERVSAQSWRVRWGIRQVESDWTCARRGGRLAPNQDIAKRR